MLKILNFQMACAGSVDTGLRCGYVEEEVRVIVDLGLMRERIVE